MRQPVSTYVFSLCLAVAASAGQAEAIVDFENIPGTGIPSEGDAIGTQYEVSEGVSFSLEGGGLPVIAKIGSPRTAFAGPPGNTGDDNPAGGTNLGSFFLTDDGVVGAIPPPLIISYSAPVSGASGEIVDIDGTEAWQVEARDESDTVLDAITLSAGDPGTGDGQATPWSFSREVAEIYSIRVTYSGQQTVVGLALDNFSSSSPPTAVPRDPGGAPVGAGIATLYQNEPNPFRASTTIRYHVPAPTSVRLEVIDLAGRQVRRLLSSDEVQAGVHALQWDGRDDAGRQLGVGLYFCRLAAPGVAQSRKMILAR